MGLLGRQFVGRCRVRLPCLWSGLGVASSIKGCPARAGQVTRRLDPDVFLELFACLVAELGYEFSESALSDIISKSAIPFPRMSSPPSVWASFFFSRAFSRSSFAVAAFCLVRSFDSC